MMTLEKIANVDAATALETFGIPGTEPKQRVYTCGVAAEFGDAAPLVVARILAQLEDEIRRDGSIDYLQQFNVDLDGKTTKVWIIDDGVAVTVLLPDEY